ncbi:MAG: Sua5/YciO/YrdC/YwlC family protein [Parcubacteria group bacterium]|jgi:L-threonylcarbamoyladenylate synthase
MGTSESIARKIKSGKIGVIPTDTIYGVAAAAFSKKAVARAYKILKRNPKKPFIVLIGSIEDLSLFDIKLDRITENILKNIWPGKVSVILPVKSRKFEYLHRGTKTLAFRFPKKKESDRNTGKNRPSDLDQRQSRRRQTG